MEEKERQRIIEWFDRNRRHTETLFATIRPEAYYARPIPLRQPVVFYEGHFAAFNYITLVRRALGEEPFDAKLDELFERGIDPETVDEARAADADWPDRDTVLEYVREADRRVRNALENAVLIDDSNPLLTGAEAVYTILEHEAMHHETLRYMLHRLPVEAKIRPNDPRIDLGDAQPDSGTVAIPAGRATLGARRDEISFGWDNEFESLIVDVPAFEIDRHNVTNREFLSFIEDGGYGRSELWSEEGWRWVTGNGIDAPPFWQREEEGWKWRGMYELYDLPLAWPVHVTQAEAAAFARWKGRRLMSEPEYHRAAYGEPGGGERSQPWGEAPPDNSRGNFDFLSSEPVPIGSFPSGASAWGVHDLIGNGWEWTATPFRPFPGFREMASYPPYSSDFFDEKHFVMKGGSQSTAKELIRRSFRNWFRETYPYMYASFRTVK